MAKPLTRAQALENQAFLDHLCRNGNVRLSAREIAIAPSTLFHRRSRHPAFAQAWDAAITIADARLTKKGGRSGPSAAKPRGEESKNPHRTAGGETVVVRRRDGSLQVRRAQPGKLTKECEQAFLAALSATANVALSAAAAGASVAAFYRRRRNNPAFAREMRMALETGYERIEMALLQSFDPGSHADDAWRHNDPPPMPSMTPNQALQLLHLHHKTAKLWSDHPKMRKLPLETTEEWAVRRALNYRIEHDRYAQDRAVAAAAGREPAKPRRSRHEPPPPGLPALDQVTGWSRANGKPPYHEGLALFGGWRLGDIDKGVKPPGSGEA